MTYKRFSKRGRRYFMKYTGLHPELFRDVGYPAAKWLGKNLLSAGIPFLKKRLGLNTEYKRHNFSATGTSIPDTTSSSKVACMGIAQGATDDQRVGDSIRTKSIRIRMKIQRHASDTSLSTMIRLMLIKDKEIAGTTADLGDIFTSETVTGYKKDDYNVRQRYTVLRDKTVVLNKDENEIKFFTWYVPYDALVRYTGSASTNFGPNNVFLYYFSEDSDGTNLPTYDVEIETVYVDN